MSEAAQLAKTAREHLAAALNALQSNAHVPAELMDLAEPIAEAMGVLHRIERTQGASLEGRETALDNVRTALNQLQKIGIHHPAIEVVMESVASSLSKVHALSRVGASPAAPAPPRPAPAASSPHAGFAATEPIPKPVPTGVPRPQVLPAPPANAGLGYTQPLQAPPAPIPGYGQPPPAAVARPQPQPAAMATGPLPVPQPQYAPSPQVMPAVPQMAPQPVPQQHAMPQHAPPQQMPQPQMQAPIPPQMQQMQPAMQQPMQQMQQQQMQPPMQQQMQAPMQQQMQPPMQQQMQAPMQQQMPAPAPGPSRSGSAPQLRGAAGTANIDVELGAHSPSNFYKGLGGNDVIEHGGIFVATYKIPKIGSTVNLRVLLPGDYEFQANAVVQWTREGGAGESAEPGFGARFTHISPEGRQLVYRYTRNREPIFYDDL